MLGQSNMCGRGIIGDVPEIDPRGMMFMLRNGRWQPMSEPINPDRRIYVPDRRSIRSGVCLCASFAEEFFNDTGSPVGLIPCAEGGSFLKDWQEGGPLFENAVFQANLAGRISDIEGILWHQGESEAEHYEEAITYSEQFLAVINRIRERLNLTDKPVVLGEITELISGWKYSGIVNRQLRKTASENSLFGIASAEKLKLTEDGIHFDSESYRIFGRRYYNVYKAIKESR